jgi:hypothetical protein
MVDGTLSGGPRTIHPDPSVVIGSLSGDSLQELSEVLSAVTLPDRRIAVALPLIRPNGSILPKVITSKRWGAEARVPEIGLAAR